jgi:predicted component of type VI protein secretion system
MAYVVVNFKGLEVGRWPLNGPLSIGRSTECDVVVRDILLSRKHCEIAPYRNGWVASDLGSKNGTRADGQPITRRGLADGDVLTLGKTTVRFQMGRLPTTHKAPAKRPADPFEALSGTVTDFDPKLAEAFRQDNNLPMPKPAPREPDAYSKDDLYSLLNEIASSSWDSIYAQASQPKRPIPRGHLKGKAAAVANAPGAAEAMLTRRTRLGFAEELQVKEAKPGPVTRPATPLEADPAARASSTRTANTEARSLAALAWAIFSRPLAALHGWVAPAGRTLML